MYTHDFFSHHFLHVHPDDFSSVPTACKKKTQSGARQERALPSEPQTMRERCAKATSKVLALGVNEFPQSGTSASLTRGRPLRQRAAAPTSAGVRAWPYSAG